MEVNAANNNAELLAIHLIAKHEGYRAKPYMCPGGQMTIGYGFTDKALVAKGYLTRKEADHELGKKVRSELAFLRKHVAGLTPKQEAAAVSFIYNVGRGNFLSSTFYKRLKSNRISEAASEIKRWVYAKGVVLDGLVTRRAEESKYILS